VTVLTGRQTIYQMIRLAERVRQFGGAPLEPLEYKREYHRRLMRHIGGRREALAAGTAPPDRMLLPGARDMLERLRDRGVKLYLTSGTDEPYVIEEARMLDVARYFDGGIHGARDDYRTFSKEAVVRRMLADNRIAGSGLLGIGDGFVEITCTRRAGGYALGVASDEARRGGAVDEWKRRRLLEAGADMIVPDFARTDAILAALFGQEK
jgi:phosphoglycolate phosphatase-like HAD superfamily hydrolase